MAELLTLVARFDASGEYWSWGSGSTAEWLSWQCGVSRLTAREYLRVARALRGLPRLSADFGSGELSYAKVRAATRIATAENEETLAGMARRSTAAQLEAIVRSTRRGEAATDPTYARRNRSVRSWTDEDGMVAMLVKLPPEDGTLALNTLSRHEDRAGVSAETEDADLSGAPPSERRRADAFMTMVRASLSGDSAEPVRLPYAALVHVDPREGTVSLDKGPVLHPSTAERVLCDGILSYVNHHDNGMIEISRASRVVKATLRKAIRARDRRCRFPGCDNNRYLDVHHRVHWIRGGPTDPRNLVLLCTRHHHLVHEGGWRLLWGPDGEIQAVSPDGRVIRHAAEGRDVAVGA